MIELDIITGLGGSNLVVLIYSQCACFDAWISLATPGSDALDC